MTPGKGGVFSLSVAIFAAGALTLGPPRTARAEGIIESFFTSLGHVLQAAAPRLPERVPAYAEPSQRIDRIERAITPPTERVDSGPAKAFCVRTCDGHYFPVRAHAGMSTALFSGRTIDYAVARDGSRYANLATAYAYRWHVVVGCTCNDQLVGMRIMPPNPGAPPEASIVPLPEQAHDDNPRSAQR
jgi:hypothetical protein